MFRFLRTIKHAIAVFFIASFFSFTLFFIFLHPVNLAFFLGDELRAAVGTSNSASVPLNPINRLAMQLDQKEKELTVREQSLNERAADLEKQNSIWNNSVLLAVFITLAILGFLVTLNFYLDRKRGKELRRLEKEKASQQFL